MHLILTSTYHPLRDPALLIKGLGDWDEIYD